MPRPCINKHKQWCLTFGIFCWWLLIAGSIICAIYGFSSVAEHGFDSGCGALGMIGTVSAVITGGFHELILQRAVKRKSMKEETHLQVYLNLAIFLCFSLSIFFGLAGALTSINTDAMFILCGCLGALSITLPFIIGSRSIIGTEAVQQERQIKMQKLERLFRDMDSDNYSNEIIVDTHRRWANELFKYDETTKCALEKARLDFQGSKKRVYNETEGKYTRVYMEPLTIDNSVLDAFDIKGKGNAKKKTTDTTDGGSDPFRKERLQIMELSSYYAACHNERVREQKLKRLEQAQRGY